MLKGLFFSIVILATFSGHFSYAQSIIKDYHVNIEVDKGRLFTQHEFLFKVGSKDESWLGDIRIYHSPSDKYKLLNATLLDQNMKVIRKIKSKDIHTEHAGSDISFFDDRLVDVFSFKHNIYPYYISYSYTIEQKEFFYVDYWSPVYDDELITENASLTVTHPFDYEVFTRINGELNYEEQIAENNITKKWSKKLNIPPKTEPFSPHYFELAEIVEIVPTEFYYGSNGSNGSWKNFGNWKYELIDKKDEISQEFAQQITRDFSHIQDTLELMKALYYYLQDNTRYINVAVGIGGLEPYSADYVHSNKYGDCKALSIYMKGLLKLFGIESFYTSVYADENPESIHVEFPSQQFNHIILCVPFRGDTIWLENTSNCKPFNYLGEFTQNRLVLPAIKDGSKLIRTPTLTNNLTHTVYDLKFDSNGFSGEINRTFSNAHHDDWAYVLKNFSAKDIEKFVTRKLDQEKITRVNHQLEKPDRDTPVVSLQSSGTLERLLRNVGPMTVLSFPENNLPSSEHFIDRKNDFRFNLEEQYIDEFKINLDTENFELPDNFELESEYGSYQCLFEKEGSNLTISRTYRLNQGDFSIDQASEFYAYLKQIETYEQSANVIIQSK